MSRLATTLLLVALSGLTVQAQITTVCVSPDGKTVAAGSTDGTVRLYDSRGVQTKSLAVTKEAIDQVVFAGEALAWTASGSVSLLNTATGESRALIPTVQGAGILAVSPDSKYLAAGGRGDDHAYVWKIPEGKLVRELEPPPPTVAPPGAYGMTITRPVCSALLFIGRSDLLVARMRRLEKLDIVTGEVQNWQKDPGLQLNQVQALVMVGPWLMVAGRLGPQRLAYCVSKVPVGPRSLNGHSLFEKGQSYQGIKCVPGSWKAAILADGKLWLQEAVERVSERIPQPITPVTAFDVFPNDPDGKVVYASVNGGGKVQRPAG